MVWKRSKSHTPKPGYTWTRYIQHGQRSLCCKGKVGEDAETERISFWALITTCGYVQNK